MFLIFSSEIKKHLMELYVNFLLNDVQQIR